MLRLTWTWFAMRANYTPTSLERQFLVETQQNERYMPGPPTIALLI